jgi:PadR family transcriptional regulator
MESPVTTRAALLQALRDGPGYGLELIRRIESITGGRVRLADARVYPVLKAMEKAGLVAARRFAPKRRRGGRARVYYDLTVSGVEASTRDREALRALLARRAGIEVGPRERARMARRLLEAAELAEFGAALRRSTAPSRARS